MPKKAPRPIFVMGGVGYVPLSQDLYALVDPADIPLVASWVWSARRKTRNIYAVRNDKSGSKARTVSLHMHILPPTPGYVVDHVNGNSLDNRRANLRYATNQQNLANAPVRKDNTTGFKGVSRLPSGRYRATIRKDKKLHLLGIFDTPEAANAAYYAAAERLYGEFARAK